MELIHYLFLNSPLFVCITLILAFGYEDIAFFRRVFKRETGMAPAEYRNVFSGIAKSLPDLHADSAHVG